MRYEFDRIDILKGGWAKSAAKTRAAKRNGKLGGRPPSRTLLERILKRSVAKDEVKHIKSVLETHMLLREQQYVWGFFECPSITGPHYPTKSWRRIPPHVRQAMNHVRALVKIYKQPKKPTWRAPRRGSARWAAENL